MLRYRTRALAIPGLIEQVQLNRSFINAYLTATKKSDPTKAHHGSSRDDVDVSFARKDSLVKRFHCEFHVAGHWRGRHVMILIAPLSRVS